MSKKHKVHLADYCIFAGIVAKCGAAMQHSIPSGWDNRINSWGKQGIKVHKPIEHLTFQRKYATCLNCLRTE